MPKRKLLNKNEERILIRLAKEGNKKARDMLVEINMGSIYSVALKYKSCSIPVQDLVQEGVFGFIHGILTFDLNTNNKLITHTTWWVKNSITKAIRKNSTLIRLPVNQQRRISKELKKTTENKKVSPEIEKLMNLRSSGTSFDSPVNSSTNLKLSDVLKDNNDIDPEMYTDKNKIQNILKNCLTCLNSKERNILTALYGLKQENPRTVRKASDDFGISKTRVEQYRDQSLTKIRRYIYDNEVII